MARMCALGDHSPVMRPVVASIPPSVSTQLPWRRLGEAIHFEPGGVLFYAGHFPYGSYFITKGRIQLANRGRRQIVGPGAVLGLDSCMKDSAHRFTAVCVSPVTVRFVNKSEVLRLIAEIESPDHHAHDQAAK